MENENQQQYDKAVLSQYINALANSQQETFSLKAQLEIAVSELEQVRAELAAATADAPIEGEVQD